jgi:hypothetical protein
MWPVVILVVAAWCQPVAAQSRIEDDPGYVDFSRLASEFGQQPIMEINIHGALLRLVAEASELEDPELARMLRRIRGVYVRGFELEGLDVDRVRRLKDNISTTLERDRWDSFIRVRDRDEDIDFFVRMQGDDIAGLVVMSIDRSDDETVFLNIVGNIRPEEIGRIGRKFGVGGLDAY